MPLRRFQNQAASPLGRVYFIDLGNPPVRVASTTRNDFLAKAAAWYQGHGEPVPQNLWALAMDCMCKELPNGFCTGPKDPDNRFVGIGEVRNNTQKLFQLPAVTPGEVVERTQICLQCACNNRTICTGCNGLNDWARNSCRRGKTPSDDFLGVCTQDKVLLTAAVSVVSDPVSQSKSRPATCWRISHADSQD